MTIFWIALGWLVCAVLSYLLIRWSMTSNDMSPWTQADRAFALFLAILFAPIMAPSGLWVLLSSWLGRWIDWDKEVRW